MARAEKNAQLFTDKHSSPEHVKKGGKLRKMLSSVTKFLTKSKSHDAIGQRSGSTDTLQKRKFPSRPTISSPQIETLQVNLLQIHRTHSFKNAKHISQEGGLQTKQHSHQSTTANGGQKPRLNPNRKPQSQPLLRVPPRESELPVQPRLVSQNSQPQLPHRPSLSRAPPPFPTTSPYIIQRRKSLLSNQSKYSTPQPTSNSANPPPPPPQTELVQISPESLSVFKTNPFSLSEKLVRWSKTGLFQAPEEPAEIEEDQGSFITDVGTSVSRIHLRQPSMPAPPPMPAPALQCP